MTETIPSSKFNIGDKIYFMKNDEIISGDITGVALVEDHSKTLDKSKYNYKYSCTRFGYVLAGDTNIWRNEVKIENKFFLEESLCFKTYEELLQSLKDKLQQI